MARGVDFLAADVETDELSKAKSAERRGDESGANIHEYHYLLAREFHNVMRHLNESPPRQYTYEEWSWFLKLMGEDEGRAESHRTPLPGNKEEGKGDAKSSAPGGGGKGEGGGKKGDDAKPDIQDPQTDDAKPGREWSWIGSRSPLMGEMEEAEWVLRRLSITLEKALKRHSESVGRGDGKGGKGGREGGKSNGSSSSSSSGGGGSGG